MEITATVVLGEDEARALVKQLAQAQAFEPELTADALAERLLTKLFRKWADDEREAFIQRNRPMLESLITALAVDPDRDAKLAVFNVEFGPDGVLRPRPPVEPPPDQSPIAN